MRTPTKQIEVRDWDFLFHLILEEGPVQLEDMTPLDTRAFNMWARKHKGYNIKYQTLMTGGVAVALGKPYEPSRDRVQAVS